MERLLASVLAAFCVAGCADDDVFIDVDIDADPCTAERTQRLVVTVFDGDGNQVDAFERAEGLAFPTGVRLVSSDAARAWRVEAVAYGDDELPFAYQVATGTFDTTRRALLLDDRCWGVECTDGTCIAGTCSTDALAMVTPNARPTACPLVVYAHGAEGVATPCGTIDAPCSNAQQAVVQLRDTGGLAFLSGLFDEGSGASLVHVEGAHVAVRAWPERPPPILDGSGFSQAIEVDGEDIVIDGLEVRNGDRHGISVNGDENLRVTIRNCDIHDNGDVYDMDDMFPDAHAGVVVNNGASGVLVEHNHIHDNRSTSGFRLSGVHANLVSSGDRRGSVFIRNNRIERNTIGVHTNNVGDGADVIDNVILDNETHGISIDGGGEVRGNRVCNHPNDGILVRGEIVVTFNSVVDNAGSGIRLVDGDGWVIARNVLAFNATGLGGTGEPDDGPNLYFMNDVHYEDITPARMDEDVIADPMFAMRDDCSLVPMAGSPAIGASPETSFGAR